MRFKFAVILISGLWAFAPHAMSQPRCADSSVHIRYITATDTFHLDRQINAADGGRLCIGGFVANGNVGGTGYLVKFDRDNNVAWSKKIIPGGNYTYIAIRSITETGNGNIAISGLVQPPDNWFQVYHLFYAVFSSTGTVLVQEEVNFNNISDFPDVSKEGLFITSLPNDSLLFSYYTRGYRSMGENICLLATDNDGNPGWSTVLTMPTTNDDYVNFNSARVTGNQLTLYGSSISFNCEHSRYAGNNFGTLIAVSIDLTTRQVISQKMYCVPVAGGAPAYGGYVKDYPPAGIVISLGLEYFQNVFFLENGGVAISRAYQRFSTLPDTINWLFNISWFDASFNPVKSEFIATGNLLQTYVTQEVLISPDGTQHFSFADYPGRTIYYSVADASTHFYIQKKMAAPFLNYYFYDNRLNTLKNGSMTSFTVQSTRGQTDEIHYIDILAKDINKNCFGTDTAFLSVIPAQLSKADWTGPITSRPGEISLVPLHFTIVDFPLIREDVCIIRHNCSSMRLSAPDSVCTLSDPVVVTCKKNINCDSKVDFHFDNAAIKSYAQPDDTTLVLRFAKSWSGYISASVTSCPALNDSVKVYVSDNKKVDLGPDTSLCNGNQVVLNAGSSYNKYLWNTGSADSLITISQPGTFYVDATDNCGRQYSDTILIMRASDRLLPVKDTVICKTETIRLQAAAGYSSYSWSPSYNIDFINTKSVDLFPERNTLYTVSAEKYTGCTIIDSVNIIVNDCPEFFYTPSAFSPNRDGTNDYFKPVVSGPVQYGFSIYNRWGQLVFHTTDSSHGWDGTLNGKPQDGGVYIWQCNYSFRNKKKEVKKGTVLLIR
jgi:gliding motility-associated-like protein